MRALFVSHSAATTGGAELALLELVDGLRQERLLDVHVVLPEHGPLIERLRALGVASTVVADLSWIQLAAVPWHRRHRYLAKRLVSLYQLSRLLKSLQPDVVMSNTMTLGVPAFAALVRRIPHIWFVHEFGDKDHGIQFDLGITWTKRLIGYLSNIVVVNSRCVHAAMAGHVNHRKLTLLQSAVDISPGKRARGPRTGPHRVLLVGKQAPSKGQEDAVRAIAALVERGDDVALRLVGDSDVLYGCTLRRLAVDLGVEERIEFVGPTRDVSSHYSWADVVLMCSRMEAFGRVTVEAMKHGLPVVGAAAGGTEELIDDGVTGLLYTPGDPLDLADKLHRLMQNPAVGERMGTAARDWANERFSLARFAAGFEALATSLKGRA